ncbi:MAG: ankyrin repeat domain-containing protein [Wolbachia endosymbiont of Xenopsylla cheopis]
MFAFEIEEKSIKKISLCDDINKKITTWQKQQSSQGKTALMHAVIDGNLKMVKLLCQKGKIDIIAFNAQDNNGMTAVMYAAELGHRNILKFFYNIPTKLTDDIDEQNFSYVAKNCLSDLNALMLAIVNGHIDCLEFLYCKEIQHIINHRDNNGRTAVMLALDEIENKKIPENEKEIENAKRVLDELFRVIEIVFSKRDEKYLNPHFDNKLNLTIQDKDKHNVFAYAKEAKCEQELLDFIASIPIDAIIPDLSIHKLLDGQQSSESVKCPQEDLTGWVIFSQASEVLFESSKEDINLSRSVRR